jgi:hypothetical protein
LGFGVRFLQGLPSGFRKNFFFEKKKQKTFDDFGCGLSGESEPRLVKVFCFFFSKNKSFLAFWRCQNIDPVCCHTHVSHNAKPLRRRLKQRTRLFAGGWRVRLAGPVHQHDQAAWRQMVLRQ